MTNILFCTLMFHKQYVVVLFLKAFGKEHLDSTLHENRRGNQHMKRIPAIHVAIAAESHPKSGHCIFTVESLNCCHSLHLFNTCIIYFKSTEKERSQY